MEIFLGRELSARGGPTSPLQILVAPCASTRRGGMGSAAGAVQRTIANYGSPSNGEREA
jgi:hypothetical protein